MPSKHAIPALYIGRFQPFHLGHLDAISQALQKESHLLIGIGSAEDSFLPENPFTASERFEMIRNSLDEAQISREKYSIIPIRNINNYALWVRHVEQYCPKFGNVYTGSEIVKDLFEVDGKHQIIPPKFHHDISATKVRETILSSQPWHHLVPAAVANLIIQIKGEERIKKIQ